MPFLQRIRDFFAGKSVPPITLAAAVLTALLLAVPVPGAAQDPGGATPDHDSEPDLAGLLDAVRAMTMTPIEPGLSIGTAAYPPFGIRVHVFDFARDRFAVKLAVQTDAGGSRAADFLAGPDDVFAVNGGYFERSSGGTLSSSGLLVVGGRTVAGEHDRAGSGVIFSGGDGVGIAYRSAFGVRPEVDHVLQTGPILVDPGGIKGIYRNVGGRHNRSAACLRGERFTVFVIEGGISLFQVADLLSLGEAEGGFGCDVAINLDGGPSTQAALRSGTVHRDIPGGTPVHNAVIVARKPGG